MRTWAAQQVPRLREPVESGTARMYVCGITPYDATHIGHAATYLTFDLLHRRWLDEGRTVEYVQNLTDVDDPLLERARLTKVDWRDLATSQAAIFAADMLALRILPPTDYVGVVEAMPEIIAFIERLEAAGGTYGLGDDVYFDISHASGFGAVAGLGEAEMLALSAARGGDPDRAGKRHPLDCLLWQAERPGDPAWESPWGRGRPGWHVECAAIALARLGDEFDVQGGGRDLCFPHHELTAAEASAVGVEHAQEFVHTALVSLDGAPMSKSAGNLVLVGGLLDAGQDPMAIRLALLAHHHDTDWEWTTADMLGGVSQLARWRTALNRPVGPPAAPVVAAIREALAADLDAPSALAAVDDWCRRDGAEAGSAATVTRAIDALLGVKI